MAEGRKRTGEIGEAAVCRYLEAKGHTILERNRRAGHLETDIITLNIDGVHFVEVKTRRPPMQLDPQECVTVPKQRRLVKAAQAYLSAGRDPRVRGAEVHFDVAAVILEGETETISIYEDAFIPIFL